MSAIAPTFSALRARGEKALVAFVTAGDPSLDELPAILAALEEGGADLIEVGIPFSDPIADGPTIQASSQRALDRGVTPRAILAALTGCRSERKAQIVLMGYMNPILRAGLESFADQAAEAGASGTIVSDLTPEESDAWAVASERRGLDTVFLAAPTSTDARLDEVGRRARGFVYAVSRTGVTGTETAAPPEVTGLVRRIKERTDLPVCVGFGISRPEHVQAVCEVADGAVVGSHLVKLIAERWQGGAGRAELVQAVAELKAATRG